MQPSQLVDSYKFRDVVQLWAHERLVHEVTVAQELAKGIIIEGLRFQSVDPKWVKSSASFRGYPYVGYVASESAGSIVIRAAALEHLLVITREAIDPSLPLLSEESVTKNDFKSWLVRTGRTLPQFWFSAEEKMQPNTYEAPARQG